MPSLDRDTITATAARIAPYIRTTPVVELDGAELGLPPCRLTLKLEHLQPAGSFKTRGAFANLVMRDVPAAGVVAASGGNHGAAVAYAARRLGVRGRIFVPTISSPAKIQRIRDFGAELEITGERYADALAASERCAAETGALPVHAFDQDETLLGQGTLALELARQAPHLDTVLVAVGGGGLLGGLAAFHRGALRLVGVEPREAPTLHAALAAGHPVDVSVGGLAADALGARRIGERTFPLAQQYASGVVLVDDDALRGAQRALWSTLRLVAEPAGAAPLAALLAGAYVPAPGERVGVVISGANTTAVEL